MAADRAVTDALPRLLRGVSGDGRPLSLRQHIAVHGPLPPGTGNRPDGTLIDAVRRSGLCGRGGARFPTAVKLASVAGGKGRAVVVANGAEGEPASAKDRTLLTRTPHLVLDGAAVAARAVGAAKVVVAVNPAGAAVMEAAAAERASYGGDPVTPVVVAVPDRFVAGEESALVNFLNRGPGLPTWVPPRPYERGVGGKPTLVSNVETLAHLALIARRGPEWFRAVGTATEPGSTLITVGGAVRRPGVYEVARGVRLVDALDGAGGASSPLQALLIGGYAGCWVKAAAVWDAPLSDEGLATFGGVLAAGVVTAFPAGSCGIAETARIMSYLAAHSAGQCGPCVHGLAAMAATMDQLARGQARRDSVERLGNWAWQVTGRGACHHPDGSARMVTSALKVFSADLAEHRQGRPCRDPAGGGRGPYASTPGAPAGGGGGARRPRPTGVERR